MTRKVYIAVGCFLLLAGCGRAQLRQAALDESASVIGPNNQQFSLTNYWNLTMGQDSITPRYERARSSCLSDKNLNCDLLNANVSTSTNPNYSYSRASLTILLPHDQIDGFRNALLQPTKGEPANDVAIQSSTSRADNVERERTGAEQKIRQLTAYRDQLVALSKRPGLSVDDNIKLGAEMSRVQGELDTATEDKANADDRVARELVHISLDQISAGPIADVWNRASSIFIQNVANVLEFLIGVVPWIPIIGALVFLVSWLWKFLRNRRQRASSAA